MRLCRHVILCLGFAACADQTVFTAPGHDAAESTDSPGPERASIDTGTNEDPRDAGTSDAHAGCGEAVTYPKDTYKVLARWNDVSHDLLVHAGSVFAVDNARDRVVAIDTKSDLVVAEVATGRFPYHLTAGGGFVFVLNAYANEPPDELITVIDSVARTRAFGIPLPRNQDEYANYPANLTYAGDTLFVSNFTFSTPSVFPIDATSGQSQSPWPAGPGPDALAYAAGRVFVVNFGNMLNSDDDVIGVYTSTGTSVDRLETGGRLLNMVATQDGVVFATRSSTVAGDSRLIRIDATTLVWSEQFVGDQPQDLVVEDGQVFVAIKGGPGIAVVDVAQPRSVRRIDLGSVTPPLTNLRGIAVGPCNKIYLESDGAIGVFQDGANR